MQILIYFLLVVLTLYSICNTIILFLLIPTVLDLQRERHAFSHPTMPAILED